MNLLKRHKWESVKKYLSNYDIVFNGRPLAPGSRLFDRKKCKKCGLEKVSVKERNGSPNRYPGKYTTFYFKTNDENVIIEGGPETQTVPYGCGFKEEILLHDDDFAIDF